MESWLTIPLKVQLRADQAQTISFVISCSTPAYVAVRNIVLPRQGSGSIMTVVQTATTRQLTTISNVTTVTDIQTTITTPPAETTVVGLPATVTANAALGLAGSIALMNRCARTWITIYGNDDFEHIPPLGLAIAPSRPADRFGHAVYFLSQDALSSYCVESYRDGPIGCGDGTPHKREAGIQERAPGPYHPLYAYYRDDKMLPINDRAFEINDVLVISCTSEPIPTLQTSGGAQLTISNTGCASVTGTVLYEDNSRPSLFQAQSSLAYAGNTVANVSLGYPVDVFLQVWSRNEPGWLENTFRSIDGGDFENLSFASLHLFDTSAHTVSFECRFATSDPPGAMTQVVHYYR